MTIAAATPGRDHAAGETRKHIRNAYRECLQHQGLSHAPGNVVHSGAMLLRTVLTVTALLAGATAASAAEAIPEPEPKGRQVVTPGVTYESRTLSDGNVLHIVRSAPKARFSLQPESVGQTLSSRARRSSPT